MNTTHRIALMSILLILSTSGSAQRLVSNKYNVIISAIKGTAGKADTVSLSSVKENIRVREFRITGEQASFFSIISVKPKQVNKGKVEKIVTNFQPDINFLGIARAVLEVRGAQLKIELTGLSTKGLEGENEAPLSVIVEALGYKINTGWTTLPNNLKPELQGEELAPALYRKADSAKPVEMIPVARYSPDFAVNFGLYTNTAKGPRQHQNGILATAERYPEHQILFPAFAGSVSAYDPGDQEFGFYAISPSHTIYSEDNWNILFYPTHAAHAMRIYPVHTKEGDLINDTFLVCMEEAANGDYNDYVFLVRNIKPAFIEKGFTSLMNGINLEGWYIWLQDKGRNNDPNKIFTVEGDGILHDTGRELGYIMTEKSFENYHFKLEFKWGNDRWPPRENNKRDSGICYNIPVDETDKIWPESIECQIQEGDVGDFWLLGYSTIQVEGKQNAPYQHSQIVKKRDAEKPNGEWNTVEVISFNGKCVHIVNGVVVNYGENASLVGGRILLQSEYAEIYYRNARIREF
jgi:hypothetical protein